MTAEQAWAFLSKLPPRTGKLATVRVDGRPHVAPVWYDIDDDGSVVLTTGGSTVKGRNLTRDPRSSPCVEDERPPFSFVVLEGVVERSGDLEQVRLWATRIGGRYLGADRAEECGARNGVPGRRSCACVRRTSSRPSISPTDRFAGARKGRRVRWRRRLRRPRQPACPDPR